MRISQQPEDYLYAGLSEMRLDNVEDGFKKLELGLTAYPEAESMRSAKTLSWALPISS